MTATPAPRVVDFWFDPECPCSGLPWLHEIEQRGALSGRHHVMSLHLLNEQRTDVSAAHRHVVDTSRGPAEVATAAVMRFVEQVFDRLHTAVRELVLGYMHYLSGDLPAAIGAPRSRPSSRRR